MVVNRFRDTIKKISLTTSKVSTNLREGHMTVGGIDREVSRDMLLRVARENDIRNAASIIRQVKDSVMSFEALANEQHIEKPVCDLVLKYISDQISALK